MPYEVAKRIAEQNGKFEPLRVNHWALRIYGVEGMNSDVIELALNTFSPPSQTIEPLEIPYANENRKVAGRVTRDNLTLTVRDYVGQKVYEGIKEWEKKVFNSETGYLGLAANYKKQGQLIQFGPDGKEERTIKVNGIWPSKVSMNDLDQGGSDQVLITVELVMDTFEYSSKGGR